MDMSRVEVSDGCRIAARFDGPDAAPVLVLSNSLGTNLEMWSPQMEALRTRFRVLRYDSRGHGASDVPRGDYSIERLGADVVELLDAHRLTRVHFCGLSKGGMVGQWLGANAPDRIDRLVLANTAASMGPPSSWQERIDLVLRYGMSAVADSVVERWFTPELRDRQPSVVAGMRAMLLATAPVGYAGCCAAIRDLDLRESAARISPPTLIIAGASDAATPPERAVEIARAMKNAPRIVTLAAAHMANVEQAEGFNRALLEFLS